MSEPEFVDWGKAQSVATEDEQRQLQAYEIAAKALWRGGHRKQPTNKVLTAATNYVINHDLARAMVNWLEDGSAALRFDEAERTLIYVLRPDADEPVEILVAKVPKRGKVTVL